MRSLLRGLKWPKTGLRENRVIVQFPDVYKHRPKTGWWLRTGGFTLYKKSLNKIGTKLFEKNFAENHFS